MTIHTTRQLFIAWVIVTLAGAVAHADSGQGYHEHRLREAGVKPDAEGLLNFFRGRTLTDADRAQLAKTVQQLGSASFRVREKVTRELVEKGRVVLPLLKEVENSTDLEIARRAKRCIREIEKKSEFDLIDSALHLLAQKQLKDAIPVLLAYLPSVGEMTIIPEVHATLVALGVKDGKAAPSFVKTLSDSEPTRRAAAAFVLGHADARERQPLQPLLRDSDPRVRLLAAMALVRAGEKEAVPPLLVLLTEAPLELAEQAENLLYRLAGDKAPPVLLTNEEMGRRRCRAAWEEWWQNSAEKIDWTKLNLNDSSLGLTLVCEAHLPDGGRVWECGFNGKHRWQLAVQNPIDAQLLPGQRVLVADCHGNQVAELDFDNKVLWSHKIKNPIACQRLGNGNTFIATYSQVLEVARDGTVVYTLQRKGNLYYARKMENGHIVSVHNNGQLVETDREGKEVLNLSLGGMNNWAGVEALPNGHFLVARASANEVVEVDRGGKVFWQCSVPNPNAAERLANGNTLVASHDDHCVYEFDRDGKQVWKHKMEGRPFRVRRR